MNDYLWDKTGDADEDVRRLEELLGTLRQRPAELRLPAEAPAVRAKTLRPFRPAYAVAAALALAAMAGLWLAVTNLRSPQTPHTAATSATEKTRQADSPEPASSPAQFAASEQTASSDARREPPSVDDEADERTTPQVASSNVVPSPNVVRRRSTARVTTERVNRSAVARASAPKRRGARDEASAAAPLERQLARGAQTAPPAPTREQQAAKEQLMFALRLTSAKLGDVKRKASGVPAPSRPSPDEQNKLR
ncbi:MAG TPA: hypothetical protein VGV38_11755 [Pyrinomonadaceae bacterium]|nr:hypothetical protein [Pyrinomonadaceae bacterium]